MQSNVAHHSHTAVLLQVHKYIPLGLMYHCNSYSKYIYPIWPVTVTCIYVTCLSWHRYMSIVQFLTFEHWIFVDYL